MSGEDLKIPAFTRRSKNNINVNKQQLIESDKGGKSKHTSSMAETKNCIDDIEIDKNKKEKLLDKILRLPIILFVIVTIIGFTFMFFSDMIDIIKNLPESFKVFYVIWIIVLGVMFYAIRKAYKYDNRDTIGVFKGFYSAGILLFISLLIVINELFEWIVVPFVIISYFIGFVLFKLLDRDRETQEDIELEKYFKSYKK